MAGPLPRRLVALIAGSALVISGVGAALAAGDGGGLGLPSAGCNTYTDPKGDGIIFGTVAGPLIAPVPYPVPNDPDLDITGVVLGVNATRVTAYIRVDKLASGPQIGEGDSWEAAFTIKKKALIITGTRGQVPLGAVEAASGQFHPENHVSIGGTIDDTIGTFVSFDTTASMVILSIDRVALEKALGGSIADENFTAMSAQNRARMTALSPVADAATAPTGMSVAVGSNACFGAGGNPTPTPTVTPTATPTPTDSPTPDPTPTEDPGPPADEVPPVIADAPRAGCFAFTDAAGDAKPGSAPLTSPQNDDDLDLLGVAARSTATELKIFGKVAALGSAPTTPVFTGHVFGASFSVGGKKVTLSAAKAGAATATPATVKATALFDTAKSTVVFTIAKADLVTVAPVADGTPLTDLTMTSAASNPGGTFAADTAAGSTPEQKTYAYGDNACFFPPAAKLAVGDGLGGVYSDVGTVVATLTDADDNALDNTYVHLQIPGMSPLRVVTNGDGEATFAFPVTAPAGLTSASVWYVGDEDNGPVTVAAPFTVAIETSVLKAVAGKGTVTATLTDNDKTPLAGQPVLFTVGKKITTIKTNAKGVAVLTKQLKGTSVKVSFAGVKDHYTATPAVTVKVL